MEIIIELKTNCNIWILNFNNSNTGIAIHIMPKVAKNDIISPMSNTEFGEIIQIITTAVNSAVILSRFLLNRYADCISKYIINALQTDGAKEQTAQYIKQIAVTIIIRNTLPALNEDNNQLKMKTIIPR